MKIANFVVAQFSRLFKGSMMPCNDFVKKMIREHLQTDCEIVERNDKHIVFVFPFEDMPITIECTFKYGINNKPTWVNEIILL